MPVESACGDGTCRNPKGVYMITRYAVAARTARGKKAVQRLQRCLPITKRVDAQLHEGWTGCPCSVLRITPNMFSMSTSARLLDKLPSTQPSQVCFATFLAKPNCVRTLGRATRFTSDQEGPPCRKARSSKRGTAVVMIRDFPNGFGTSDDNDITTDIPMQRPPQPKRALDELVDFPCVFTVKVVGIREVRTV